MSNLIQPFLRPQKQFTMIHDYVIDVIMPSLSSNSWRLLCFIMRHTLGKAGGDRFSYPELMKGSGIKSSATLRDCLRELTQRDFVRRFSDDKWRAAFYSLNSEYTATPALEIEAVSTSKTKVEPTSEIETASTLKTKEHLIRHDIQTCDRQISARSASQPKQKNKVSSRDPRTDLSAIKAYHQITGRYPPKELYDEIIALLGESPDLAHLNRCWVEASKRSLNHRKDIWLFDWYPNGIQEANRNGQKVVGSAAPPSGKYDHLG